MKQDKNAIKDLKKQLTQFTNSSWFGQVTNSEHGMDIWKAWQEAFGLDELYNEVHKEYLEYYDYVVSNNQSRISSILMIFYVVNIVFGGIQMLSNKINIEDIEVYIIIIMIFCALAYPMYYVISWIKHKFETKY